MRLRVLLIVLASVVGVGGSVAVLALREDPGATAAEATSRSVVAVERRTLTDDERLSGDLGYADERTVSASGVGMLTKLPREGSVVRRGGPAYRVDDEPVVLLTGSLPLWRDLAYGVDDGDDVRQLERNLVALGYEPGMVDDHFSGYTREAVEELQEDRRMEETGVVTAGQFLVLPTAIRVGAPQSAIGAQLAPGTPLYEATGTGRVVTIDLDPSDESLARVGARAVVTLPDGSTVKARISSVGTVATSSGESEDPTATATLPLTLSLDRPGKVAHLSASPVSVDLTRETRRNVLVVPVTALVALAEGGHAVRREGGELVAVETGLYAAGYVEVTDGLAEGDRIEVPE